MKLIEQSIRVPIASVKGWAKNARKVKPDDMMRLKKQIQKLGMYQPLVCFREAENYVVLSGNMRLTALQELGAQDVWCTVIECESEQEKLEISLSANDRAGYYDESALLANFAEFPAFPYDDYKVDFSEPILMMDVLGNQDYNPENKEKEIDENLNTENECPSCRYKW